MTINNSIVPALKHARKRAFGFASWLQCGLARTLIASRRLSSGLAAALCCKNLVGVSAIRVTISLFGPRLHS